MKGSLIPETGSSKREGSRAVSLLLAARLALDIFRPVDDSKMLKSQAKHMELFIHEVIRKNQLVMITLSNAKVYVGNAMKINLTEKTPAWLMVTPLVSGYRSEADKSVKFNVSSIPAHGERAEAAAICQQWSCQ